jgi:hypothetical protein
VSGQRHAPSTLYPGKGPPVPIGQEAGWAPERVWTQRIEEKSFAPARDRTSIVRSSSPYPDTVLTELYIHRYALNKPFPSQATQFYACCSYEQNSSWKDVQLRLTFKALCESFKVKQSFYTPWRRLGERRCSSYSFSTSALDGVSGERHAPAALLPLGKGPPVPIVQEAGWALEPVWTQVLQEKSFAPAGDRTPIARSSSP